jgi:sugar O-acyltransferase (sialic acid O-acetyltransferase NeuD family)
MSLRKLVIIGTGGLGRETAWALAEAEPSDRTCCFEFIGFLTNEETQHGQQVCGLPVLGAEDWLNDHRDVFAVCCVGDPTARRELVRTLIADGVKFGSAIHPSVAMSSHVEIGVGCVIGARAVLTSQVTIGDHVVIGVGAIISHDVQIDDYATVSPGVTLAGSVHIGAGADLGAGATVIPGCSVGAAAVVGAQAVIIQDVAPGAVVVGVPAASVRQP